jgi:putative chitobiose transport system substrate-binding protein
MRMHPRSTAPLFLRRPRLAFRTLAVLLCLAAALSCTGEHRDGRVRLELWTLALSPTFDDYMQAVVADFEREHPGVEVVWVDVPFDALDRKLVTAAAAGKSPDVVNFSDRQFARYVSLGAMADLSSSLPGDPDTVYQPGALRIMRIDGELLGLPWYLTTQVRLANREALARGGLSPEALASDWAGLRDQAGAYHAQTGGFLFSIRLGEDSLLPVLLLQSGLVPFKQVDGRLVADLTRADVVAEVRAWVELFRSGALPRSCATGGHQAIIEAYQSGQLAMIQTGANMLGRVRDSNPEVFAQTAVLPPLTGVLGRPHIAVMPVGVMRQSRYPELAAALAWHLTSAANQTELARRSSVLPSTRASLADPFFAPPAADEQDKLLLARAIMAGSLSEAVAFTPAVSAWPDMRIAFNEGIKRVLLNGQDVQTALEQIEREWNALLRAAPPATLDTVPTPEPRS